MKTSSLIDGFLIRLNENWEVAYFFGHAHCSHTRSRHKLDAESTGWTATRLTYTINKRWDRLVVL